VALSFHPHPRVFFGHPIRLISTDAQRLEALRCQELDRLYFVDFSTVAGLPAVEFVRGVLLDSLRLKTLVVGEDFRFGRGRDGDLDALARLAAQEGFTVIRVPAVEIDGGRVTSSRIRKLLAAGAVREAGRLLENPYFIDGVVARGAGRGRKLGFPTMNIASENPILPPGVFQTRLVISGRAYPAVTNIGCAPTFGAAPDGTRIETHVPGFRRMVYGRRIRLHFIDKIRDEREFADAGRLTEQIRRDIASLGI
jgi:riboflavin kinase/FMN adenylyltransferase